MARYTAPFSACALALFTLTLSSPIWAGGRQQGEVIVPEANRHSYETWGYAPAIKTGDYIHVSGVVLVLDGEGSEPEQYARAFEQGLKRIDAILQEAGASLDDVIKINSYHTDLQLQLPVAVNVRKAMMKLPHPAWTAVGTTGLAIPEGVTEVEVVAYVGD